MQLLKNAIQHYEDNGALPTPAPLHRHIFERRLSWLKTLSSRKLLTVPAVQTYFSITPCSIPVLLNWSFILGSKVSLTARSTEYEKEHSYTLFALFLIGVREISTWSQLLIILGTAREVLSNLSWSPRVAGHHDNIHQGPSVSQQRWICSCVCILLTLFSFGPCLSDFELQILLFEQCLEHGWCIMLTGVFIHI